MHRKRIKSLLALLMALVLLASAMPTVVFAESGTEAPITVDDPLPEAEGTPTPQTEEITADAEDAPPEADATEAPAAEQPAPESEPASEAEPPIEATEELPAMDEIIPDEPSAPATDTIKNAITAHGHAYVTTLGAADVYSTSDMTEHIFTITNGGAVLLATEFVQRDDGNRVKVWFVTGDYEAIVGYVAESALVDTILTDDEANTLASTASAAWTATDAGELVAFVVEGSKVDTATETPIVEPTQEPATEHPIAEGEQPQEKTPASEPALAQVEAFVAVDRDTRVYPAIDETVADGYNGDEYMGVFVNNAIVQVETVEQDALGRYWYRVRYMYGDDFADGRLKWTDYAAAYVLAVETSETAERDFTVTDYAFNELPSSGIMLMSASPMNGFSLKSINAPVPSFYVGQGGLYGSSGKDSDYLQIAKSADHGTIYATPHYLDGFTVYCLEHNLSGPGENISGGGQEPTGPYVIVDIDSYRNNPGYSSIIYHDSTMHAIAWVLRHTYPFMALDRSDSDNLVWSRVAGQFAIRQVIRELEGAQYVRSYWNMDNFYRASGQAPAVYLEYARWLAENGIARGRITGSINVSGKSTTASGSAYVGTVTLTTDADLMRISRSVGSLTGNSAGSDGSYYYLNSGDTISVTSSSNSFSITVESVSSEDEEASFLVGVPSVEIQKVLIPQYGYPYKLKSVSVRFEVPLGSISVTKRDVQTGAALAGAVFELLNATGSILQTQTTGANGIASFANLQPGTYTVREKGAPQGYTVDVSNTQNLTVTAGNVSTATFTNDVMTGKIRIVKKDQLTKEALAGATFTITRLSAPAGRSGVGTVVAVITTDASGTAETGWLDWGRYRVEETGVPEHFVNNHFSVEIDAYENGKTYTIEVENEPTKGYIKLVKTDRLNGNPIEGVRFDVFYNDEYGSGLATTMITGKDGVAISEPLRKGRYIVREHGAMAGYVFEEITMDATVRSDETTELQATNQPVLIKLKIYKRDTEEYADDITADPVTRGDGILTGAEFQVVAAVNITDRQGNLIHAKGDIIIESLKTDGADASVATAELWPGVYDIVELTPPTGYQPSDKPVQVDARDAAKQSQEAVIVYEGVKTNKILYGAFEIIKFLGDNQVHPEAGVVETPEKGAEFEVFLKSAGSYENARECERDTLTTNRYGKGKTKALPYGVYVLRQTVGQEGHAIMRPLDVMIDGTENLQDPPSLILNNQAIQYRLKIVKTDSETGNPIALAGTAFKLRDGDGNYVRQTISYPTPTETDTYITDESGSVTLPETVTWGQYYIEEVQSPEGYLICAEPVPVFVGQVGDAPDEVYEVVVEVPNDPVKGRILVEKKGLQLTGFEAVTDAYGNEVQQPVYEDGYLAGAVFEMYAAETIIGKDGTVWYEQDALVDTITTTADGADASKELPLGKYYLVETSAPEGYVFDSTRYEVELTHTDNATAMVETSIEIGNEYLPTEIMLQKEKEALQTTNHGDGTVTQTVINAPGEGFVFGLYSSKDIPYGEHTLMADTLVATGATNADGNLTFSGYYPHGEYYICELSAPVGWKPTAEHFPVSLTPENQAADGNIIRVSLPEAIHNELIYTPITLTKTDFTGEQTLPGAQIEVKNDKGEVIYRATTDANGEIPDIPVVPGKYTFREVLAPNGYALNEAEMSFTVDENGNITGDTVIRDDYTRVTLLKHNESGQPLAGVEFALLTEDGTTLMTAVSNELGIVTFERIPYGSYTIEETEPPTGYLKSNINIQVTVDGTFINSNTPLATIVNCPNEIVLHKVDTQGNPLAGATFALLNAYGEQVMAAISNTDGLARFVKVPYGQYTIRELQAPDGFAPMEGISVTVDDSWMEPVTFTCVNIPDHYEFIKVDNRGNPLAGVKFVLEDDQDNYLRDLVSAEDGIVYVNDLTPGSYVIRETEALEGYNKSDETIELTIDEHYIAPVELYRFVNYSGIQTGFEITMTPTMWVGAGLMLAGVALALGYAAKHNRKRTKRRK